MPIPFAAIQAGLGLASGISGLLGGNKQNRQNEEMYTKQLELAKQQGASADQLSQMAQALMSQGSALGDGRGGGVAYNPTTGRWEPTLNQTEQTLQGANDAEALARDTIDQNIRRQGLVDSERLRGRASVETDAELAAIGEQRRGIGMLDPSMIADMIAGERAGAVNAGYDDVQEGLNRMSVRTGGDGSAVAAALARNRSNDIMQTRGNPMLDALGFTESFNSGRRNETMDRFNTFNNSARSINDAGFGMTDRFGTAQDRATQQQAFDLQKTGTAGNLAAGSAGIIGNSARNLMTAGQARQANRVDPLGQFLSGASNLAGSFIKT